MSKKFDLPDEILSLIPTDPYDQLDLARKITSMAIASRLTNLQTEADRLQHKLHDKDRIVQHLQHKVSQLETAYQDAESRFNITREHNMKLLEERDSLAFTVKKLTRDLAKLETFKRQLLQSLNDEDSPKTEIVDIGTYDQSMPKAYPENDDEPNGYAKSHSYSQSTDSDDVSKQPEQTYSMAPYISPRLTPIGTPKAISTSISPRTYSSAGSPQRTSGTASPSTQYEGRVPLSYLYSSSQQSSSTNSPPPGHPLPARPRIDGKEFFRQARTRLSLEQFSAFLANIKEFNAQRQSREETLRKAQEIFGTDNYDLYVSFQRMINRDMH